MQDEEPTKLANGKGNCIISIASKPGSLHFSMFGRAFCGALDVVAMAAILELTGCF
jgi:hypothetical protein